MKIVPIYAALLAVLFVVLSIRIIRLRRGLRIALGHADNPIMLRATRVHANFAEYVPLALLMIALVETTLANAVFVHVLGAGLLAGRLSHAYGVSQHPENYRYRIFGTATTFAVLLTTAAYLLFVCAIK